ncbi:MAG: hypothetical protein GEU90_01440 [Gemmatimonas sp.]|nr:hypothetical protein [Gemmatimonas sp.]
MSAGLRLTVVPIELPDILVEQLPSGGEAEWAELGVTVPAVGGEVSIGVFDGLQIAPGMGGIGGLSLLGSASVLPFDVFDTDGFDESDIAFGIGARVNLLEESFYVPGVSLSLMRRSLSEVRFGDICPSGIITGGSSGDTLESGTCAGSGDAGEFTFDLTNWSTRLVASKRFLGAGATLGLGRDGYDSTVGFGFRAPPPAGSGPAVAFRVRDIDVGSSRWTVFGNLSFTFLIASIAAEAGWVQGDSPIGEFSDFQSNFDPGDGSWYGGVGARISL